MTMHLDAHPISMSEGEIPKLYNQLEELLELRRRFPNYQPENFAELIELQRLLKFKIELININPEESS